MINYKVGDLFCDLHDGDIVLHIVNDLGKWGRGFVLGLSNWDGLPEKRYRYWRYRGYQGKVDFVLGEVQFVEVDKVLEDGRVIKVIVGNMLSQRGLFSVDNPRPFCSESFRLCLGRVLSYIDKLGLDYGKVRIKCPKLGCGLGGGSWLEVSGLLEEYLCKKGINITVYVLD